MNKHTLVYIISIFIVFFTQSCEDSNKNSLTQTNPEVNLSDFPNSVGSYWVYEVYDSINQVYDTFTVSITDTLTLPVVNQLAYKWEYPITTRQMGQFNTPQYIVVPDSLNDIDTIRVYRKLENTDPWFIEMYEMPFDSGNYWLSTHEWSSFPDSFHVEGAALFNLNPYKQFTCSHIRKMYNCGDECAGVFEFLFADEVGFVQMHTKEIDLMEPPENQINVLWVLIDYHIE